MCTLEVLFTKGGLAISILTSANVIPLTTVGCIFTYDYIYSTFLCVCIYTYNLHVYQIDEQKSLNLSGVNLCYAQNSERIYVSTGIARLIEKH